MEHYEEWDMSIPSLPPRSRLYCLEPIGIGTQYVESLTGYIARLAETHCVTPKNLLVREILPAQNKPESILVYHQFWAGQALTLNSLTPVAKQWVEVLQSLTLCDNLRFLTMLTWSDSIGVQKLVRRTRAWCPACYEEWRQNHCVVYEPLLWSLIGVALCHKHRQPLITECLQCQKSLPFLTQSTRPGYCSHCGSWLGNVIKPQIAGKLTDEPKKLEWVYWVTEVVGELLAYAPSLSVVPQKGQIARMLHIYLDRYAKGNIGVLSRLVKIDWNSLKYYLRGTSVPDFDSLLRLCHALQITPLKFLTEKDLSSEGISTSITDTLPVVSRGKWKPVTPDDVQHMRQILETVLADEKSSPPLLSEVAKRIGFDVRTVRKHCPDLSKRISARYRRKRTPDENSQIKQALEMALVSDEIKSLSAVAQQLGYNVSTLSKFFPDLCRAVTARYLGRIDSERIERQLQEAMITSEEVPSVNELARQMGYERRHLVARFPDLCRQVSLRRATIRSKRREERMVTICSEIRYQALLFHQQGVYPSSSRISQHLSDRHAIRTKEGHETWCLVLEELGYPTAHLKKQA